MIIAGILYASGETAANGVLRFLRRLAGRARRELRTPRRQGGAGGGPRDRRHRAGPDALAGAGLAFAGVPHAGLLTAVVFVLCIAQLGPILVVAPATIWLYSSGAAGRGTVLLVFSVVAVTLDNVLRPVLIRKGADLPLLLILAGVIGGVLAFGVVGLFVGPVLLAVTWTLLVAWVGDLDRVPVDPSHPGPRGRRPRSSRRPPPRRTGRPGRARRGRPSPRASRTETPTSGPPWTSVVRLEDAGPLQHQPRPAASRGPSR